MIVTAGYPQTAEKPAAAKLAAKIRENAQILMGSTAAGGENYTGDEEIVQAWRICQQTP